MNKRFYIKIVLSFLLFPSLTSYSAQEKINTTRVAPLLTNIQDLVANYLKGELTQSDQIDQQLLEEILTIVDQLKECIE